MLTKFEEGFLMTGHFEMIVIEVTRGPEKKVLQDGETLREFWEVLVKVDEENPLGESECLLIFRTEREAREVKPGYVYLF